VLKNIIVVAVTVMVAMLTQQSTVIVEAAAVYTTTQGINYRYPSSTNETEPTVVIMNDREHEEPDLRESVYMTVLSTRAVPSF